MGKVYPVARIGDSSNHGGVIISSAAKTKVEGKLVARVGDMHSCPIPGHGVTPITTGSPHFQCENQNTARGDGGGGSSACGCGALIVGGATRTNCE